jgi:hypothetical protein
VTGVEVKEKVVKTLRSDVWLLPKIEDVEAAMADSLSELEPCTVLTPSERDKVWRHAMNCECGGWQGPDYETLRPVLFA